MSAPLPVALRPRFQRLIEEGFSGRAAAARLQVSPATRVRWASSIRQSGEARIAPQGRPKGKGKLDPHRAFFAEVLAQDGDMTMAELSAALHEATGVRAHPSKMRHKSVLRIGYPNPAGGPAARRYCATAETVFNQTVEPRAKRNGQRRRHGPPSRKG